jgi:RNA polymerase sigma-70 factor, ECF subfamily
MEAPGKTRCRQRPAQGPAYCGGEGLSLRFRNSAPDGPAEVNSAGDRKANLLSDMRNSGPEKPVSSTVTPVDDADGLSRLLESLRPDLLRFAHWLARDRAIAEDIVQEALLRAWRSRESLKEAASARAWLLTIVRREHARLYERKRLELVSLDEDIIDHPSLTTGDDSDLHMLRTAILKLPMEYREPLIMQVLGGFSTEEIAREMSLSATAVLTRLFRARNQLRALYGLEPKP